MLDVLIVIVCFYFSYTNIQMLMEVPLSNWVIEQYLLALVTLALLVVGFYKATRVVRAFINAQKRAAEEAKEIRAKADRDAADKADDDAGEDADVDEGDADDPDGEDDDAEE